MSYLPHVARFLAISVGGGAVVLAAMIAFGTAPPPPLLPSINDAAVEAIEREPLAPLQHYKARDGAELAYRAYPVAAGVAGQLTVAVLVHGSGGSSANMNVLGLALARAGIAAYAIDSRGHGHSGRRGDIDYIGQLEDDLSDLLPIVRQAHPDAKLVLVGHSSGGGFVLRVAGEKLGAAFSRFVLLSPYLGQDALSNRPDAGGWVHVYLPRIIGLSILNRIGITGLNGLPVLAFALPHDAPDAVLTPFWSFRLARNFGPSDDYRADAARAPAPIVLLAGRMDESFYADRYAAAFAGVTPPVTVTVIDGVGHMGMVSDPRAIPSVIDAVAAAPSAAAHS